MGNKHQIHVSTSQKESLERIKNAITLVDSFLLSFGIEFQEKFIGQVEDQFFRIRVKHWYSNGFSQLLYGEVRKHPQLGSTVSYEFKIATLVRIIIPVVILMMTFVPVSYAIACVPYLEKPHANIPEMIIQIVIASSPLLMMLAIIAFAIILGKQDEKKLRQLMTQLFQDVAVSVS